MYFYTQPNQNEFFGVFLFLLSSSSSENGQIFFVLAIPIFMSKQTQNSTTECIILPPLPFWWQGPCCSTVWSLYPGSQILPHTRCLPVAHGGWCARHEASSSPPYLPSLPPPSHYLLSAPAFLGQKTDLNTHKYLQILPFHHRAPPTEKTYVSQMPVKYMHIHT